VIKILLAKGKITRQKIAMISTWRHSGFHVFCGNCIWASFSQERVQDLADEGTVIYSAKDGKDRKIFDAPDGLAAMCSHVPNQGEQMERCYRF